MDGPSLAPPYLVLLRAGFGLPLVLPRARCALTAPFHPYPPSRLAALRRGGMFSVPLSFESPRPGVTRHTALRSSDFPPFDSALRASLRASPSKERGPEGRVERRPSGLLRLSNSNVARTGGTGGTGGMGRESAFLPAPPALPALPALPAPGYPSLSCEIWYCSSFLYKLLRGVSMISAVFEMFQPFSRSLVTRYARSALSLNSRSVPDLA